MPRLDLFTRYLPDLYRRAILGCLPIAPSSSIFLDFEKLLIFLVRPPAGQAQTHQTSPALPHTPNLPPSNTMNSASQSTGITPDHQFSPFHRADASHQGSSSHSHFSSGPGHQSSGGMGLPSIMNATPMNTQPTGASGYNLPPIPQQQPQTATPNLSHPASSTTAPPASSTTAPRPSDPSHTAPPPLTQQMQPSRPPPPQVQSSALPPGPAPAITPSRVSTPPPPPPSTTPVPMSTSQAATSYRPLNVKDALTYLDQVKVQFQERPDVYNKFLDIMKDFKSQRYIFTFPGLIVASIPPVS
jgi:hypothetical protein